jgi:hypothetical protein
LRRVLKPLDIDVKKKPGICGRQIMRDNVQAGGLKDYFRKSITVPFLGVTSVAPGLMYVCFWQFCKVLKGLSNSRKKN